MIAVSLYGLILLLVKLSWTVAFLAPEWGHGGGGLLLVCSSWSEKNTEGRPAHGSYSFLRVKICNLHRTKTCAIFGMLVNR